MIKLYWNAFIDIERNMWGSHRPTVIKWCLITLACISSLNVGHGLLKYSIFFALAGFFMSMVCLFVGLPAAIYIIDCKNKRKACNAKTLLL